MLQLFWINLFLFLRQINSVSKKTALFYCLCQEGFKENGLEVLKIKEFTFVNVMYSACRSNCFQNKNNAEPREAHEHIYINIDLVSNLEFSCKDYIIKNFTGIAFQ